MKMIVSVLPIFLPHVHDDPSGEPFEPHIVDRIVDSAAFAEFSATTAHKS